MRWHGSAGRSTEPRWPATCEPVRAVHITAYGWTNAGLRGAVMRLVDEGRINAVQLDLKDESGIIGFDAALPYGQRAGAVQAIYDLPSAVHDLHAR